MHLTPLYNEKELLMQTAKGNEHAFRQLFEQYIDAIYGVAFSYTKSAESTEELVQDIFLKIWLKRENLATIERFDHYLFIISRNHILNYFRALKKDQRCRERLVMHFRQAETTTPELELLLKESRELVEKAVRELPAQQQMVYELRRNKGLSLDEVARQMGISRNTARNHLNQALKKMRTSLEMYSAGAVFFCCMMQVFFV